MPEPVPDKDASAQQRPRIRITAEIVVEVADETGLQRAAVDLAAEQEPARDDGNERERAEPDNAHAVALLAGLDAAAAGIPGVEVLEATWTTETVNDLGGPGVDDYAGLDFAELFPIHDRVEEDEQDSEWQLTPRTAAVLYQSLALLADDAYDDIEQNGGEPVTDDGEWSLFDRLPRISWRQEVHWRRQIARAFDDLTSDIAQGRWPLPRCNAEELALHLAIADAPSVLDMTDLAETVLARLPQHPDDEDWDMCSEVLFQDHDILMLNDPGVDGFEDPASPVNREFGIGDLRPGNWFTPFDNVDPATRTAPSVDRLKTTDPMLGTLHDLWQAVVPRPDKRG